MNADELRALQAPIKERYRADAGAAAVTLRAAGRIGEGVTCSVQTGRTLVKAGLHPASGGDGLAACSGEVRAEGDLDFRGTLGVAKDAAVGFREIRLKFVLDTDADRGQLDKLLQLTERYCVVYQTLRAAPPVRVELTT